MSIHDVTVYERSERIGGHSNTVIASVGGRQIPVDTGFIVFNRSAYPNLSALFEHLTVFTCRSDMSLAVSLDEGSLEYSGTGLSGLFAQPSNLFRPRFWSLLRDLVKILQAGDARRRSFDGRARSASRRLSRRWRLWLGVSGRSFTADGKRNLFRASERNPVLSRRHVHSLPLQSWFAATYGAPGLGDRPGGSIVYVRRLVEPLIGRISWTRAWSQLQRIAGGVVVTDLRGGARALRPCRRGNAR